MTIFRHVSLIFLTVPAAAHAQGFQDHSAIDRRAAQAASGTVRPVDRRLKLAQCPEALEAGAPAMGMVTVRCPSLGWRVSVLTDTTHPSVQHGIIRRGDPVTVNFVASGFSVTTSGIAETDARVGERVRVRVEQKANPVMGEAIDQGTVRVGTFK